MILMGINKLPTLHHFWKKDSTFRYSRIADRISRNSFLEISRFLHFMDNSLYNTTMTDPSYDRLWKLRPLITAHSKSFVDSYSPQSCMAIDEAIILFKGRSAMKQYIPKKPIKRGLKILVRADSMNGYICEFQVYVGKIGNRSENSLGERVVKDLTRSLVGGYYTVYTDSFCY